MQNDDPAHDNNKNIKDELKLKSWMGILLPNFVEFMMVECYNLSNKFEFSLGAKAHETKQHLWRASMNINDFLDEIKLINWFEHNGIPNKNHHMVFSIFEAYDDWNEQMLQVWEPSITLLENMAIEKIGNAQIDDFFSIISADIGDILWEKWGAFIARQHLEDEMGLDNEIIDMVKRDVSWAYIEKTLDVRGLFTTLFEIYKSGYFPCSWIGTYPDGQAVVL